jgi:hypothetical protein
MEPKKSLNPQTVRGFHFYYRGCILGRKWNKNLDSFAPCYSQPSPPPNFTYGTFL